MELALVMLAILLAGIELVMSRGRTLLAWAVIALAFANIGGGIFNRLLG